MHSCTEAAAAHLWQRCVVAWVDIHQSGVRPPAVEPLTRRTAGVRNADLGSPGGLLPTGRHANVVLLVATAYHDRISVYSAWQSSFSCRSAGEVLVTHTGATPGWRLIASCRSALQCGRPCARAWTGQFSCRWCWCYRCLWDGAQLMAAQRVPRPGRHPRCAAAAAAPLLRCGHAHRQAAGWRAGFTSGQGRISRCGGACYVPQPRQQLGGSLGVHHDRALSSRSSWHLGLEAGAWRLRGRIT